MPLLIRPALESDEGLRAYVCRLATLNLSPTLFRPMLDSMSSATSAVPVLAELTGEGIDALLRCGSAVSAVGRQAAGVRFGDVIVPRKVVRVTGPRVCPKCIAMGGAWRCVWELDRYNVCDRHGLELVDTCTACKTPLSWSYASTDRCACGFSLARLQAKVGGSGQRQLCKVLASSMLRTVHGGTVVGDAGSAVAVSIDWTLVLCEFIAEVLIPIFGERHGLNYSKRFHALCDSMIASMLEDRGYRDYLRDAVFMYAASDPMTLISTLRPGRSAEWHQLGRYDYRLSELSFHRCLWDLLYAHESRGLARGARASTNSGQRRTLSRRREEVRTIGKALSPIVQEAIKCLSEVREKVPVPGYNIDVQCDAVKLGTVS